MFDYRLKSQIDGFLMNELQIDVIIVIFTKYSRLPFFVAHESVEGIALSRSVKCVI